MTAVACNVDDCRNAVYARGMCCAHYKRAMKARPAGSAQSRPRPAPGTEPRKTRPRPRPRPPEPIYLPEFLAALAAAVPPLPGAACRGRPELFDPAEPDEGPDTLDDRHTAALALCKACPALTPCAAWFDGLRTQDRPEGVIAGRRRLTRSRTPRPTETP